MKRIFTLLLTVCAFAAQAQFTANNLAVLKITSPTAIGNVGVGYATTVLEYTTAGVATGKSVSLTSQDTFKCIVEERAIAHEGQLNLTTNGKFLTAVGYQATPGTSATNMRTADKRIARIDAAGNLDLTTKIKPSHSFGGVGLRSAISEDGTSYLINSSAASAVHGVRRVNHGEDTAASFNTSQYRSLARFGGIVYGTALNSSKMFSHDAAGVATEVAIPGLKNGPEFTQCLFLDADANTPGLDLLYIADRNAGIRKFYLSGTNWVPVSDSSGLYNTVIANGAGFFALTGKMEGGKPTLYGVKILVVGGVYTSSHLMKIVDNSPRNADWSAAGAEPTATELASTTNLEQFKGVSFTPTGRVPVSEVASNAKPLIIKPSLAQNSIRIELDADKGGPLSIFNISGQKVMSVKVQNEQDINISTLPAGLYIVRTELGQTGRFVKQ
jgi:Secretion system C-terminal sorting domain